MGSGGFAGRDKFQPFWFRLKKYLFIPYSLTIIFPLYDAVYLAATRKRMIYLIHPLLCLYTTLLVIYFYTLKGLGGRPEMKGYGQ
jgi:hypothetical protein